MKDVKHNRIYIVQYDPNVAKKLNFKKIHMVGLMFHYIKRKKNETSMKIYLILLFILIWSVAMMYPNKIAQSGSS